MDECAAEETLRVEGNFPEYMGGDDQVCFWGVKHVKCGGGGKGPGNMPRGGKGWGREWRKG